MILLAAGGIGVTPVMGMIKDIYDINLPADEHHTISHCIDTVYFMWVIPSIIDYELFREEIEICLQKSSQPNRPKLILMVYVTRSKEILNSPFICGRPNIPKLFDIMTSNQLDKASLVFACGPSPMVAELWDHSINSTLQGHRVDFHHEVFDF